MKDDEQPPKRQAARAAAAGGGWDEPPPPPFGRPVQNHLCACLRDHYAALASAPLPAHMKTLLDRLESREDPETPP